MKTIHYIYKMIHLPTGRVYIGQRKCPSGLTPEQDIKYTGSGTIWKKIYHKHPNECVKIIIEQTTKEKVDELEDYYIQHYKRLMGDLCVNLQAGGGYHDIGSETRQVLSEHGKKLIGEKNPFYGKHHTEETKKFLSELNKGEKHPKYGKPVSEETRSKIRQARMGHEVSDETRRKISVSKTGGKHTNETKMKMSESQKKAWTHRTNRSFNKGRKMSDEAKRNLSESIKKWWQQRRQTK